MSGSDGLQTIFQLKLKMKSVQDYDYEMADQELVGIIFKLQGER